MHDLTVHETPALADWYIRNRDYLSQAKKQYEESIKEIEDLQDAIETEMQRRLNSAGATSFRTPGGTVVQSVLTNYNVEDRAAFGQYVVSSGHWEATQLRPTKEYITGYASENNGQLPPGVAANSRTTISIKRPTKKD